MWLGGIIMRGRLKKFIALLMTVLVLNQLPGFEELVIYAASVNLYDDTSVSTDSEDTYVFGSGEVTLTIESGVTVGGVDAIGTGNNTVSSSGTVNIVNHTSGNTTLNGGYYGSIYVAEGTGGGVVGNSISAGTINADGPIHLEGTNTVASLTSANDLAGTGTVTVTNDLSIPGTSATIIVEKNTVINATYGDLTVYYNSTPYIIAGGTTDNSIVKNYGVYVTFDTADDNISWVANSELDNLNTYLLPGEGTGTYTCITSDGYYFPEDYAVTTAGASVPTVEWIDEKEIHVSYIVNDIDEGEVVISFPTPNELETGTGALNVSDVKVGDVWEATLSSDTNSTTDVAIMYKLAGANDNSYSVQKPTAAGNYVARAILPATGKYKELTLADEFEITKRIGEGSLAVADVTAGDAMIVEINSDTHDKAAAVLEYKVAGADDSTYSAAEPTDAGSYTARATLSENDTYEQLTLIDDFIITEKEIDIEGAGVLNVADWYYGATVKPEISSGTNAVTGVALEYKKQGAPDATYTKIAPTAVGEYVARAILPANDKYKELILTDDFSISYMPVPEGAYTLVGQLGSNGYYISDVTVVAGEGYAVSNSLDGEYVEQFTVRSSISSRTIYIMDVKTGAKTDGIAMAVVNIDRETPMVDAEAGKTYYADSLAVSISDANLMNVQLNGEEVEISGTATILDLKSNGGVEEYEIKVIDRAGNVKTIKLTVAAEWTKSGRIPSGSPVKLEAGKGYTLGDGSWTVNGDSTTYAGGASFYVGGEGQYTFNKQ